MNHAASPKTLPGASAVLGMALITTLLASGCASTTPPPAVAPLMPALRQVLEAPPPAPTQAKPGAPAAGANTAAATTAPAARDELAQAAQAAPALRSERRFSLVLSNTSPELLFMALLNDTPLSVAVDPGIKGPMSIALKDVTLREALELLREVHKLDYKVIGRHILVSPAQMQTRIFTVNYPSFNRSGRSELRVVSSSISGGAPAGGGSSGSSGSAPASGGAAQSAGAGSSQESSRITTAQRNDLWGEIEASVKLLIGDKDGRQVVVSPQSGNIVVRALPSEMRAVAEYLDASRSAVQRQVMLESKIVEVQLRDSERTGINWAAFKAGLTTRASLGGVGPGAALAQTGAISGSLLNVTPGVDLQSAASNAGALLGLAFQTSNFAAVLEFLGTQGSTQVLSSPRIATMNNQKAVLKVGTDDFFVTNISTTTTPVGNTTQSTPSITLQPFFSGISLDVTPQIDAEGFITLHIHPAVSNVTERNKVLNLGSQQGTYSLPLASSDINESDAVVRARDGHIIAIGGLMRQASTHSDSGVPGSEGSAWRKLLGGQSSSLSEKRELVILLKPTIIDPGHEDSARSDALSRLLDWTDSLPRAAAPR